MDFTRITKELKNFWIRNNHCLNYTKILRSANYCGKPRTWRIPWARASKSKTITALSLSKGFIGGRDFPSTDTTITGIIELVFVRIISTILFGSVMMTSS